MFTPPEDSVSRLHIAIADILNPEDSRAYSFKAYVKNRIRQFHLAGHLDPNEVINEAYKRAISAIEAEKEIRNWNAWLKTTCFNIIRERSRATQKCASVDPQSFIIANIQACDAVSVCDNEAKLAEDTVEREIRILYQALEELARIDPEAIRLLKLRLIDKLSWEKIREHLLRTTTLDVPSVAALRQRASRTKRKLRCLYHRIENASISK